MIAYHNDRRTSCAPCSPAVLPLQLKSLRQTSSSMGWLLPALTHENSRPNWLSWDLKHEFTAAAA